MKNKRKDPNPPSKTGLRDHQHGRETVWRSKRREPITTPNRYPIEPRLDAENDTLWKNQFLEGPLRGNDARCLTL